MSKLIDTILIIGFLVVLFVAVAQALPVLRQLMNAFTR